MEREVLDLLSKGNDEFFAAHFLQEGRTEGESVPDFQQRIVLQENQKSGAEIIFRKAILRSRNVDFRQGEAMALNYLGMIEKDRGNFLDAEHLHTEALAIWREVGDQHGMTLSLDCLGILAGWVFFPSEAPRDFFEAMNYFSESYEIKKEIDDINGQAVSLYDIGHYTHHLLEYSEYDEEGVLPEWVDINESEKLMQECLTVIQQITKHLGKKVSLYDLGIWEPSWNPFEEAPCVEREWLAMMRKIHSLNNLDSAMFDNMIENMFNASGLFRIDDTDAETFILNQIDAIRLTREKISKR